jgi:hypothetical protein
MRLGNWAAGEPRRLAKCPRVRVAFVWCVTAALLEEAGAHGMANGAQIQGDLQGPGPKVRSDSTRD